MHLVNSAFGKNCIIYVSRSGVTLLACGVLAHYREKCPLSSINRVHDLHDSIPRRALCFKAELSWVLVRGSTHCFGEFSSDKPFEHLRGCGYRVVDMQTAALLPL